MKLEIETLKTKVPGWYNSFKTNNQQEREGGERQRERERERREKDKKIDLDT
tara:strand:+ start:910 stop:1065 length:156 start_codon:yes stop_codon:yes gene_type:complete